MSFKESDKHVAAAMFFALQNDGDKAVVVFVGEPVHRQEEYRGKPRVRFYFPILTSDGLQVWGVGSREYVTLRDQWDQFNRKCFTLLREGKAGSTDTVYHKKAVKFPADLKKALAKLKPSAVAELLESVKSFGDGPETGDTIPV